ncbi:hypothetical protein ACHWQZ_G012191 [Mnemiopsis leidyi]
MVRDKQGVYRGACSKCDCEEYYLNLRYNTANQRCVYCGHYPPHHWEERNSSTHQTSSPDVPQSGVARICSGTWVFISSCLRCTLLIKLSLIKLASTAVVWSFKNSLAPTRILVLFCICIHPTRFFIQEHSKSLDHEEIVSLALQILYISTLILGFLFTSSIDQSSTGYFLSWLKTSLLVTAVYVILLFWVKYLCFRRVVTYYLVVLLLIILSMDLLSISIAICNENFRPT